MSDDIRELSTSFTFAGAVLELNNRSLTSEDPLIVGNASAGDTKYINQALSPFTHYKRYSASTIREIELPHVSYSSKTISIPIPATSGHLLKSIGLELLFTHPLIGITRMGFQYINRAEFIVDGVVLDTVTGHDMEARYQLFTIGPERQKLNLMVSGGPGSRAIFVPLPFMFARTFADAWPLASMSPTSVIRVDVYFSDPKDIWIGWTGPNDGRMNANYIYCNQPVPPTAVTTDDPSNYMSFSNTQAEIRNRIGCYCIIPERMNAPGLFAESNIVFYDASGSKVSDELDAVTTLVRADGAVRLMDNVYAADSLSTAYIRVAQDIVVGTLLLVFPRLPELVSCKAFAEVVVLGNQEATYLAGARYSRIIEQSYLTVIHFPTSYTIPLPKRLAMRYLVVAIKRNSTSKVRNEDVFDYRQGLDLIEDIYVQFDGVKRHPITADVGVSYFTDTVPQQATDIFSIGDGVQGTGHNRGYMLIPFCLAPGTTDKLSGEVATSLMDSADLVIKPRIATLDAFLASTIYITDVSVTIVKFTGKGTIETSDLVGPPADDGS